ncbi:MAG: hypothetical protein FWB80_04225 [Defluviitaleaceae bacterium]|nr:hypothetical protein [Defluviitaleaceae bacterium]
MPSVGIVGLDGQEMTQAFLRMSQGAEACCREKISLFHITDRHPRQKIHVLVAAEASPVLSEIIPSMDDDDFLIVNADDKTIFSMLEKIPARSRLITYGFNNRACITASSVTRDGVQVCIQRGFYGLDGLEREPREFSAPAGGENSMSVLGAAAAWVVLNTN